VDPDEREQIFERFSRGRNATRRGSAGGTGLGLALVREHVRAHGGEVRVIGAPGGGSRFVVDLPAREAAR
jgi:signal transduction histidine kinase